MKNIKLLFYVISVLLVFLLDLKISGMHVIMEDELSLIRNIPENIHAYYIKQYLYGQIEILYCFLFYVVINVIFLAISFFRKK